MLERLLLSLSSEGSVIKRDSDDDSFLITVYEGRPLDPPVRVFMTAQGFDTYLRSMAMAEEDMRFVFPDVEPIIAAFRLFTVSLDEEILRSGRILTELRLTEKGLQATSVDLPRGTLDPASGPYQWISERRPEEDSDQSS